MDNFVNFPISEKSGKLVMKLFEKIRDVVENRSHLVCVLIDEVESIAFARSSSCKLFTRIKLKNHFHNEISVPQQTNRRILYAL